MRKVVFNQLKEAQQKMIAYAKKAYFKKGPEIFEANKKAIVIRPEQPLVVGRMEKDIRKLTDLYYQGYACAERAMSYFSCVE